MKVLVGCEYSGIVRDAFLAAGHDAISCDLLPTESPGPHIQADLLEVLRDIGDQFELGIFHPPCTYLANSGVRWLYEKPGRWEAMQEGAEFFSAMLAAPMPFKAVENPVMHKHAKAAIPNYFEFTQSIQPWQFGHGEVKRTCLWLINLPKLEPTNLVTGREGRVWKMSPGPERQKMRSRFFPGIADAMADQWGRYIEAILQNKLYLPKPVC